MILGCGAPGVYLILAGFVGISILAIALRYVPVNWVSWLPRASPQPRLRKHKGSADVSYRRRSTARVEELDLTPETMDGGTLVS
jgi:hypothetical protein